MHSQYSQVSVRKLGLSKDFALKAATGFGGGMGRTQNVCGAVSGGIMVLNMLYGRGINDEKSVQLETYNKVQYFIAEFEKIHKTSSCLELLDGCNLLTDAGQERFNTGNMRELCYSYVTTAVEILEKMTG